MIIHACALSTDSGDQKISILIPVKVLSAASPPSIYIPRCWHDAAAAHRCKKLFYKARIGADNFDRFLIFDFFWISCQISG